MTRSETGLADRRKTMMILVASPLTENIYRRIGAEELAPYFEIVVADCLASLIPSDRHPAFSEKRSATIRKVDSQKAFAAYEADYIVNTSTPGVNPFENLAEYLSGHDFFPRKFL